MKTLESFNDIDNNYDPANNTTSPVLTKYERTKILGIRMEQLARGAPTLVDVSLLKSKNVQDIAAKELEERKIPFMVMRSLPNGKKEFWKLKDMVIL